MSLRFVITAFFIGLAATWAHDEVESGGAAEGPAPALVGGEDLATYLRYAARRNPGLKAAWSRWQATRERIPQARSLDDPELSFEYFLEQKDTRYRASLTQRFPAFGKRGLRQKRASAEAESARHAFEAERLLLFDRVVKAYYEYDYLARATRVTGENQRLLDEWERVVRTRYQAGLAPFSDLVKTQVEQARVASELESLEEERTARSSVLAVLLDLPPHEPLPWPQALPSEPMAMDMKGLEGQIAEGNPEIKGAAAMIDAETYREKLARRQGLPDLMLGASWMTMPGMNGGDESDVGLMVGITLPLWRGRYRAEVREAQGLRQAAVHERDNLQNDLWAEVSMAFFKYRDAERRIALFDTTLLPKTIQALEVAKQDYASGKGEFMAVIDAHRARLEFSLMLERARADREIAIGEINRVTGFFDRAPAQEPAWNEAGNQTQGASNESK